MHLRTFIRGSPDRVTDIQAAAVVVAHALSRIESLSDSPAALGTGG